MRTAEHPGDAMLRAGTGHGTWSDDLLLAGVVGGTGYVGSKAIRALRPQGTTAPNKAADEVRREEESAQHHRRLQQALKKLEAREERASKYSHAYAEMIEDLSRIPKRLERWFTEGGGACGREARGPRRRVRT